MNSQDPNSNIDNLQTCSGCYKSLPESYFHNKTGKQLRTCIYCYMKQSKKSKWTEDGNNSDNTEPVTQFTNFNEFLDFYLEQLEEFAKDKENKENIDDFQLNIACIISSFLFDSLPKETANQIIKQISDIDEYSWK